MVMKGEVELPIWINMIMIIVDTKNDINLNTHSPKSIIQTNIQTNGIETAFC